jgi:hypothetical protein
VRKQALKQTKVALAELAELEHMLFVLRNEHVIAAGSGGVRVFEQEGW